MRSQWRSASRGMWSWRCAPTVRRAAALMTDCRRSRSQVGRPTRAMLQYSSFDTTKLEMSIDSVDRGTDRLMLRICRRMPKHVHTSLVTTMCDLTDMLLSRNRRRGRGLRRLVSPEQSQLQVDLTETDGADVVERTT